MNLKEFRQKANVSAKTVALELNCSRDHVYDIEKGKTSPKIAELEIMAKCYNTTLHELIFGNRDEEIETYKNDIEGLQKNFTELQNDYVAKYHEIIELKKEVEEKDGKIQGLKNHCEFLGSVIDGQREEINAECTNYDDLNKAYKERSEEFYKLSGLNSDLQKSYDNLKTANAAYEIEIDGLNEEIERLVNKLNSQSAFSDGLVENLKEAYTKIGELAMKYKAV